MKTINYTREDIIRRASDKLNLTHDEMKLILDTTLDVMAEILTEKSSRIRIELRNFGIFEVKPTKAKPRARNPRTNEEVYIPPGERFTSSQVKLSARNCSRNGLNLIESGTWN